MPLTNEQRAHDWALEAMKLVVEQQAKAALVGVPTEIKNSLHIYSEKYEIALEYFNQHFPKS